MNSNAYSNTKFYRLKAFKPDLIHDFFLGAIALIKVDTYAHTAEHY